MGTNSLENCRWHLSRAKGSIPSSSAMKPVSKGDIEIQWFSGTGKGGQHRNKHQNCCRVIHLETGLRANGTRSRERGKNLQDALQALARKLVAFYHIPKERRSLNEVVRTYHFERGEAIDNASGLRAPIQSVIDGDLDQFLTHPQRESVRPRSGRM